MIILWLFFLLNCGSSRDTPCDILLSLSLALKNNPVVIAPEGTPTDVPWKAITTLYPLSMLPKTSKSVSDFTDLHRIHCFDKSLAKNTFQFFNTSLKIKKHNKNPK